MSLCGFVLRNHMTGTLNSNIGDTIEFLKVTAHLSIDDVLAPFLLEIPVERVNPSFGAHERNSKVDISTIDQGSNTSFLENRVDPDRSTGIAVIVCTDHVAAIVPACGFVGNVQSFFDIISIEVGDKVVIVQARGTNNSGRLAVGQNVVDVNVAKVSVDLLVEGSTLIRISEKTGLSFEFNEFGQRFSLQLQGNITSSLQIGLDGSVTQQSMSIGHSQSQVLVSVKLGGGYTITNQSTLQVDLGIVTRGLVVIQDGLSGERYVHTGITFSRDVEIVSFELRELLEED
mmetsp:Transcript_33113/g.37588  ORF Transcript_33113/g.37588 Transcript_33113/m.37588 type:complete len:287 (+) Transcript_33113:259-1119(+)